MNVCRALWTGLLGLLLPLFSASPAPAAPVPDLPKNGVVRYFHYWAEYGEKAERPGGLERVRFELQRNRLYFSQGRPMPDTFSVQTDGALNREIVPVLAGLDLADWPGQMDDSKLYGLSESEKARLCRWHFSAVFEPEKPDALPLKVSFSGADDGTSPKRLAAEQAIRDFFGPKVDALKAATPRKLTGLLWLEHGISYDLDVEDGITTLARRKDGKRVDNRSCEYHILSLFLSFFRFCLVCISTRCGYLVIKRLARLLYFKVDYKSKAHGKYNSAEKRRYSDSRITEIERIGTQ